MSLGSGRVASRASRKARYALRDDPFFQWIFSTRCRATVDSHSAARLGAPPAFPGTGGTIESWVGHVLSDETRQKRMAASPMLTQSILPDN
ncbi:hypothetical protein, partial [Paracoccus seriniphilus]|uniref:hypothetical protein n=1 Tax=Paracoccus seriniphilus TaxID=184748 RepID=UPI0035630692